MARAGGGNIPGNNLGQGFTSPSTFTHVPGAYGAPTGAVGGATDGRRRLRATFTIRERLGTVRSGAIPALSTCH